MIKIVRVISWLSVSQRLGVDRAVSENNYFFFFSIILDKNGRHTGEFKSLRNSSI